MLRYLLILFFFISIIPSYSQNAYITNRGDSTISVINTTLNTVIATIPVKAHPSAIVVSPDASRVYISYYNSADNTITGIYTINNTIFGEVPLNIGSTYGGVLDISPDGLKVYVACRDTVFVIDAITLNITDRIATEKDNSIQGIAVSTDGKKVYVNGYHKIIVIDAVANTVTKKIPVKGANFLQLAISPDNTKLYGADKLTGYLHVTNLLTDSTVDIKVAPQNTNCVSVSSDGKRVYTSNYKDGTVSVVDGAGDTLITSITVRGQNPFGISLTPDNSKLYVANFSTNNVNVINTATYEITDSIPVGKNPSSLGKFIGGYTFLLPVVLIRFSAALYNRDVQLSWQTTNETDLSYFSVERSVDNHSFVSIENVYAQAGKSSQPSYSYTDKNAGDANTGGILYYRLQMVDKDGRTTTSNIAIVKLSSAPNPAISFYPNPVRNQLRVTINGWNGPACITITDMSGKTYYSESKNVNSGISLPVYTAGLPAGIYILHVTAGKKWKQKFVKE